MGYKTRCASCGAEIFFIKMKTGSWMPCNIQPVEYQPKDGGDQILVSSDGQIVHGAGEGTGTGSGFFAYMSHFATCSGAAQHRKRERGKR